MCRMTFSLRPGLSPRSVIAGFSPVRLTWSPARYASRHAACQQKCSRHGLTQSKATQTSVESGSYASVNDFELSGTSTADLASPDDLQRLTALRVGNVYTLGLFSDASELASAVKSDVHAGLDVSNTVALADRIARYGVNSVARAVSVSFWRLLLDAMNDFTVLVLLGAGATSLALEYSLASSTEGANWVESASILAAVCLVVLVTAVNNWQKECQFRALQEIQAEGTVRAVRGGTEVALSTSAVLVGDLLLLEAGDMLCADGVLVAGNNIKVDESHLTGEADDVYKDPDTDQALYSGSKVMSGFGRMLVTAVGRRSQAGAVAAMISAASSAATTSSDFGHIAIIGRGKDAPVPSTPGFDGLREETVLQRKLAAYATTIGRVGLAAAVAATTALAWKFTATTFLTGHAAWNNVYIQDYLSFVISGVTILVVAVPEGLPLAVTISLAYSVMRMLDDNNLVRHLSSAETMGTATVICTDKTGTLTQNRMAVTKLWLAGEEVPEVEGHDAIALRNLIAQRQDGHDAPLHDGPATGLVSISDQSQTQKLRKFIESHYSPDVVELLKHSIAINSTANIFLDEDGQRKEVGNRTEVALLQLALATGCDAEATKRAVEVIFQLPFSSEHKRMTTIVQYTPVDYNSGNTAGHCGNSSSTPSGDGTAPPARVFTKGAAEIILSRCRWSLHPDGGKGELSEQDRQTLLRRFQKADGRQQNSLRVLCLAYRDLPHTVAMMKLGLNSLDDEGVEDEGGALEQDMTLVAIMGLQDPLRPEVPKAIAKCQMAGIDVKMLTGDNARTAADIAQQCGILPAGFDFERQRRASVILEGEEFRARVVRADGSIDGVEFSKIWPNLHVLARCTPADKFAIVTGTRAFTTDIVAMTGDGTNDAPALRAANVGFAMNSGTQVAKEAADIVLLDDNFASLVQAVMWGRNVYANVSRFLQFQLTINLVAVATAVGGAIVADESPLTAVQMLWINLIMDSLASLALATGTPDETLLRLPPYSPDHQFLDLNSPMMKHVLGQAAYQLGVMAWVLWAAPSALGIPEHVHGEGPSVHHTIVFNAFVAMQLFNQLNARTLSDDVSVSHRIFDSRLFWYILGGEAILQATIVMRGGPAFGTTPLSALEWCVCLGFGAGSLLVREGLRRVKLPRNDL